MLQSNWRKNAVVVVPLYRDFSEIGFDEQVSLKQLFTVLGQHDIYFVAPRRLDLSPYYSFCNVSESRVKSFYVSDHYFLGKDSYSRLLTSSFFYEAFSNYANMLICQTDAYIFRDELDHWAAKGYSFIGAPWFSEGGSSMNDITGVGNGGFSMRGIPGCLSILRKVKSLSRALKAYEFLSLKRIMSFGIFLRLLGFPFLLDMKVSNYAYRLASGRMVNEDFYWCDWVPRVFRSFHVAPVNEAISFAFECNPRLLFNENNQRLPMGCHAWSMYDKEFWEDHIRI